MFNLKYKKPNQKIIDRCMSVYKNTSLKECLIGSQRESRIIDRDSPMLNITDPDIFLEWFAYPLYIDNIDKDIAKKISALLLTFAQSEDTLEFFQCINFLYSEKRFKEIYDEEPPFSILNDNILNIIKLRMPEMKDKMVAYSEGDFKGLRNMYDLANELIKGIEEGIF